MIIGITFLSFLLSYLSPGDPAQILLNNQGVKASEEALQSTRHELGLDQPFLVQYGTWLTYARVIWALLISPIGRY